MEVYGTLEKNPEFSGTLFFVMSKEALSGSSNHPEKLRNLWNGQIRWVFFYI